MAEATPLTVFQGLVNSGDGRVIGRNVAPSGEPTMSPTYSRNPADVEPVGSPEFTRLEASFRNWNAWTIDVPGNYYLEVIEKFYKRNELAAGSFVALGQRIDLSRLRLPIYLLAASADEVVAPEQLLAVERLVERRRSISVTRSRPAIISVSSWENRRLKNTGRGSRAG